MATKAAQRLCGYYPQSPASDPRVFMTGLVQLLANYSPGVIESILSPTSGIPAKYKFLPAISEIRDECEARCPRPAPPVMAQLPPEPEKPRHDRPTIEQLRAKYGKTFGLTPIEKPQRRLVDTQRLFDRAAARAGYDAGSDIVLSPYLLASLRGPSEPDQDSND